MGRVVLSESVDPPGAPGRTLGLTRVTLAPGAAIPLHHHAGDQASTIERGTLTYWVVGGPSVPVKRDGKLVHTIKPGHRFLIPAGDSIVERPATIHHAANQGNATVSILIASLFTDGAHRRYRSSASCNQQEGCPATSIEREAVLPH